MGAHDGCDFVAEASECLWVADKEAAGVFSGVSGGVRGADDRGEKLCLNTCVSSNKKKRGGILKGQTRL
jgi:hypothetical protein